MAGVSTAEVKLRAPEPAATQSFLLPEMAGWNAWPLTVIEDLVISRGGRKLTLDEMVATILGHTRYPM